MTLARITIWPVASDEKGESAWSAKQARKTRDAEIVGIAAHRCSKERGNCHPDGPKLQSDQLDDKSWHSC
jgi:hypothetical protein